MSYQLEFTYPVSVGSRHIMESPGHWNSGMETASSVFLFWLLRRQNLCDGPIICLTICTKLIRGSSVSEFWIGTGCKPPSAENLGRKIDGILVTSKGWKQFVSQTVLWIVVSEEICKAMDCRKAYVSWNLRPVWCDQVIRRRRGGSSWGFGICFSPIE